MKKILIYFVLLVVFVLGSSLKVLAKSTTSSDSNTLMSQYVKYVDYCIRVSMKKNNVPKGKEFSLQFNVDKAGNITAYEVLKASDYPIYDKAVIKAVLAAGPFQPFPAGVDKTQISYQIHFNGYDTSIGSYADVLKLANKVEQTTKPKNPLKISDAKMVFTNSIMPESVPSGLSFYISRQVQRNWNPPLDRNSEVRISFRVSKTGVVDSIQIIKGSNYYLADNAAIKAIRAINLRTVEFDMAQPFVTIKYSFFVRDLIK